MGGDNLYVLCGELVARASPPVAPEAPTGFFSVSTCSGDCFAAFVFAGPVAPSSGEAGLGLNPNAVCPSLSLLYMIWQLSLIHI